MPVQRVIADQRIPVQIWADDVDDRSKEQSANIAELPFVHRHLAMLDAAKAPNLKPCKVA